MLTREQFLKHLRDALNHLYDPDRLRRNPLAALFGVADRFDAPSRLQTILTEAIEALKPNAGDPPQSPNRRIYDLLLYRYVQQFSQHEVADQLGVSVRHLRREQHTALETLACQLWEQFHLEIELGESMDVESGSEAAEVSSTVDEELAWLKDAPPESPTDLGETLPAVLELIKPLATQHGVQVDHIRATGTLPKLAMHPVAVRQTLLNLLSAAIHRASGGQVRIKTKPLHWEVEVQMQCRRSPATSGPTPGDEEISLEIARRLVELSGGRLVLSTSSSHDGVASIFSSHDGVANDKGTFEATLTLPALEQLPVLAIDDNTDTLQLLQRYTAGTRYRLIGTQDPEQALSLAEENSPQVIVLDVMMPQVDGWEVLGWLRQHPLTRQIPIVVCTIMAQEELALSLGASSFVRKPITRQAFLAALDRQV